MPYAKRKASKFNLHPIICGFFFPLLHPLFILLSTKTLFVPLLFHGHSGKIVPPVLTLYHSSILLAHQSYHLVEQDRFTFIYTSSTVAVIARLRQSLRSPDLAPYPLATSLLASGNTNGRQISCRIYIVLPVTI
jgi:hypothetical protein